jgi:hypothetical protein
VVDITYVIINVPVPFFIPEKKRHSHSSRIISNVRFIPRPGDPVMSWDVAIVKIRGTIRPLEEVEEDDYLPLGKLSAVQTAIRKAFPSVQWSDATEAYYAEESFAIEFGLSEGEPVRTIILNVRHGSGDPIPALLNLTEPNGWLALDVSTSEFLDAKDPSRVGWEGYKSLVTAAKKATKKPAKGSSAKKKEGSKNPAKGASAKKKDGPKRGS